MSEKQTEEVNVDETQAQETGSGTRRVSARVAARAVSRTEPESKTKESTTKKRTTAAKEKPKPSKKASFVVSLETLI